MEDKLNGLTEHASSPKPSKGRVVFFNDEEGEQYPAIITKVWSDTLVNLNVFADTKGVLIKTSVPQGATGSTWQWPSRV